MKYKPYLFEQKGDLYYLGQEALNNGTDIFIVDGKWYLAEAHGDLDFTHSDYDEECEYCYDVTPITKSNAKELTRYPKKLDLKGEAVPISEEE